MLLALLADFIAEDALPRILHDLAYFKAFYVERYDLTGLKLRGPSAMFELITKLIASSLNSWKHDLTIRTGINVHCNSRIRVGVKRE